MEAALEEAFAVAFGAAIPGARGRRPPPDPIAFAATGYANALLVVSEMQIIQLRVPSSVQGRVFGAKDTVEGACFLVGLLGAGALVAAAGVRVTLATGAGICAVCMLAALVTLRQGRADQTPARSVDGGVRGVEPHTGAPAPASDPFPRIFP